LAKTLAEHDEVACAWYFGGSDGVALVEKGSAGNLKATWCESGARDWLGSESQGEAFLRHATQIKNIWVPYGE
jgi:aldehyde dehydrogenase (NAD+)